MDSRRRTTPDEIDTSQTAAILPRLALPTPSRESSAVRRALLELVVCPRCRGSFTLDVFTSSGGDRADVEILEGRLRCGVGHAFPVIGGVPRLLSPPLLRRMEPRYPEFFAAHPEFVSREGDDYSELSDTLDSFTRQRLDYSPPGPAMVAQWRANLRRYLGGVLENDTFAGKRILDVGCGFGRHMYVASEQGAEVVGIDLSGGVDRAYAITRRRPNCHVVQGNIFERPVRDEAFDIVWSFGVLHHMPDPAAGFRAIVPFVRRDGGLVAIWVYGYSGMAWTYRLSHMRALHRRLRHLPGHVRARASTIVAGVLSAFYWEPLRLASAVGFAPLVRHLPLSDYVEHSWRTRIAGVHDRLSTPITHFHGLLELSNWYRSAGLKNICVDDTDRRGWRASGSRVLEVAASPAA